MSQLSHRYSTDWHCKTCRGWHRDGACCPAPTLIPEAQAVLEAVEYWSKFPYDSGPVNRLQAAYDAYRAALPPKDYAPDKVPLGARFRYAEDSEGRTSSDVFRRIEDENGVPMSLCERGWEACYFVGEARLIPLPDQDA